MKTANTDEPLDAKLVKLRERETALKQQAQQLEARAEHLSRVRRGHLERLARRVDAHEKIILGALVKKAGLDVCRLDGVSEAKQPPNITALSSIDCRVASSSASYDRELILGGLLWLASVLNSAPGEVATVPNSDVLREAGRLAGANVADKKAK